MKNVRLRKQLAGNQGNWPEGSEMQMGDAYAKDLERLGAVEILSDVEPERPVVLGGDGDGEGEDSEGEDPDDEFTSEVTPPGEMETAEVKPATETPDAQQGRSRSRPKK